MLTAAVVLAVLVGALAQSVSGIGLGLVCGPLLVASLGAYDGVRVTVLLSLALNVVLLVRLFRSVEWPTTLLLLVPAALATPLLARLARELPERPAAALAGAVVVLGTLLLASGARWPAARGRRGAVGLSVVAAGTNVVAGVGGPPLALWAANAQWPVARQRASLQAVFLGLNVVALPSLGLPEVAAGTLAGTLAALAVGVALGVPVAARVSERAARRATLALSGAGGATVLVTALLG